MADNTNQLTGEHKEFIVKRLAAFYTPRDICQQIVAKFGVKCNENDILANDPRISVVSFELFTKYRDERERVLIDPESAPFADQKARLIALSRQAERYESNNQPAEARAVYRQIAEEMGIVGGKAGVKVPAAPASANQDPIEEIRVTIVDPKAPKLAEPVADPA